MVEIEDRNDRKRLIEELSRLNHIIHFNDKFLKPGENENDGEIDIVDCLTKPFTKLEIETMYVLIFIKRITNPRKKNVMSFNLTKMCDMH